MAFRINRGGAGSADSPESLFLDTRTKKVQGLLSHQADVLRRYVKEGTDREDVALQLPTGSGKTLVGLLIAEWRRRKFEELCVYLCPTNQLVYQVAEQAKEKYGLKVNAFVGKKSEYSQEAKSEYLAGEAVAITSYSGLFNTKPFFDSPTTIILDDAHAAENYIASMWSLKLDRYDEYQAPLFFALVNIFKPVLTSIEYQRLVGKEQAYTDKHWVEKIPTPRFFPLIAEITAAIEKQSQKAGVQWEWMLLKDHLEACHVYLSLSEIFIRPFLPPTFTHIPFSNAVHRVYMSATLGDGGELERISGRKAIHRIKASDDWDKHGVGRRLFFFPGRSMKPEEALKLSIQMIDEAKKALVLVPDDRTSSSVRDDIKAQLGYPTFDARAIEVSKRPFLEEPKAVAVVANRYDGIDFIDDQCRLTVILGLPRATNLQERFIIHRMGAVSLLNDRILTRMVQAFGRCTRSPTDYAAIIILGDELLSYLTMRDRRDFLHAELQAELQFGLDQAKGLNAKDSIENLRLFLNQSEEWQEADQFILSIREGKQQKPLPGAAQLGNTAPNEIKYQECMWARDYEAATDICKTVIARLQDRELRGYRALWEYFAGCAAWLADRGQGKGFEKIAKQYFREARKSAPMLSWLADLVATDTEADPEEKSKALTLSLLERIERLFERLGILHDGRFAEEESLILDGLQQNSAPQFEASHTKLGTFLGYEAEKKKSKGTPDSSWLVSDELCFVFEDYSDAKLSQQLDLKKARQANGHPNWVKENLPVKPNAKIVSILISPITTISHDALPQLTDVILWPMEEFREWARQALGVIREIRRSFPESGDLVWRANATKKLDDANISPASLLKYLNALPKAKKYPTKQG